MHLFNKMADLNGGAKPKKSLVLNAFVEMCRSAKRDFLASGLTLEIQAAGISLPVSGDIPTTNHGASTKRHTG